MITKRVIETGDSAKFLSFVGKLSIRKVLHKIKEAAGIDLQSIIYWY